MLLYAIEKILYIGSSLNIDIIEDFSYVKEFVFVDNQPRSKSDRYYYSDRDNNKDFINDLISITKRYEFNLDKIFILDETYYKKVLNIKKKIYYSFFEIPVNLNPELYIFKNKETNQIIKYYISTNILYNMNSTLLQDIKDCDALIINEYIPHIKLFDYFDIKMKILIGYVNTMFSSNDDYIKKILFKFTKYYLFNNNDNKMIECNDFMDIILNKIKIMNNDNFL